MEIHRLPAIVRELRSSEAWREGKRSARTLVKGDSLRATLAAMPAGARLSPHRADGPITVQVLEGRIRFRTDSREEVLAAGAWLSLPEGTTHSLEAIEDCAILVTVASQAPVPHA
jgi:quercetin dioxygenase-like cupin family protein